MLPLHSLQRQYIHIYSVYTYTYFLFFPIHTPNIRNVFFKRSLRIPFSPPPSQKDTWYFSTRTLSAECPILHYWLAWSMIGSRIYSKFLDVQCAECNGFYRFFFFFFFFSSSSKEFLLVSLS